MTQALICVSVAPGRLRHMAGNIAFKPNKEHAGATYVPLCNEYMDKLNHTRETPSRKEKNLTGGLARSPKNRQRTDIQS